MPVAWVTRMSGRAGTLCVTCRLAGCVPPTPWVCCWKPSAQPLLPAWSAPVPASVAAPSVPVPKFRIRLIPALAAVLKPLPLSQSMSQSRAWQSHTSMDVLTETGRAPSSYGCQRPQVCCSAPCGWQPVGIAILLTAATPCVTASTPAVTSDGRSRPAPAAGQQQPQGSVQLK